MCIKDVDNYPSTIKFVSFLFNSVPDRHKTQEM